MAACANDPSKLADGYCPELDISLSREEFSKMQLMPAFRNKISLVPLHQKDDNIMKDLETGQPISLYSWTVERPIATETYLVGSCRGHDVVSIQEAAKRTKDELVLKLRLLRDHLMSLRLSQNHCEKLLMILNQSYSKSLYDAKTFFKDLRSHIDKYERQVEHNTKVLAAHQTKSLMNVIKDELPVAVKNVEAVVAAAGDALENLSDIPLLYKRKNLFDLIDDLLITSKDKAVTFSKEIQKEISGQVYFAVNRPDIASNLEQLASVRVSSTNSERFSSASNELNMMGLMLGNIGSSSLIIDSENMDGAARELAKRKDDMHWDSIGNYNIDHQITSNMSSSPHISIQEIGTSNKLLSNDPNKKSNDTVFLSSSIAPKPGTNLKAKSHFSHANNNTLHPTSHKFLSPDNDLLHDHVAASVNSSQDTAQFGGAHSMQSGSAPSLSHQVFSEGGNSNSFPLTAQTNSQDLNAKSGYMKMDSTLSMPSENNHSLAIEIPKDVKNSSMSWLADVKLNKYAVPNSNNTSNFQPSQIPPFSIPTSGNLNVPQMVRSSPFGTRVLQQLDEAIITPIQQQQSSFNNRNNFNNMNNKNNEHGGGDLDATSEMSSSASSVGLHFAGRIAGDHLECDSISFRGSGLNNRNHATASNDNVDSWNVFPPPGQKKNSTLGGDLTKTSYHVHDPANMDRLRKEQRGLGMGSHLLVMNSNGTVSNHLEDRPATPHSSSLTGKGSSLVTEATFNSRFSQMDVLEILEGGSLLRRCDGKQGAAALSVIDPPMCVGQRIAVVVEQLMPTNGLSAGLVVGACSLRSLHSLAEEGVYFDFGVGQVFKKGSLAFEFRILGSRQTERANQRFAGEIMPLQEGDRVEVGLGNQGSIDFLLNGKSLCTVWQNDQDSGYLYAFVGLNGRVTAVSLARR